jgi:hypothetical protein
MEVQNVLLGSYMTSYYRKRRLSPPRQDAFSNVKGNSETHTSYKDVMKDTLLEKERHEVLMKIEKKQREEREQKKK